MGTNFGTSPPFKIEKNAMDLGSHSGELLDGIDEGNNGG
jgi:hypothetical protein